MRCDVVTCSSGIGIAVGKTGADGGGRGVIIAISSIVVIMGFVWAAGFCCWRWLLDGGGPGGGGGNVPVVL